MGRWGRILVAAAMVAGGLGVPAALEVVAASPAGASSAMTFQLSPCPGSGATGKGSVTISQTGKSLTITDRISNDLPNAGDFVLVADATTGNPFGSLFVNSKGSAFFEAHQTTTTPTGVNSGDSIVFVTVDEEGNPVLPPLMASDSANCGG
jgi:hypothetical protein